MRGTLYRWARLLGDAKAIKRGRIGKRIANRVIGRVIVKRLWVK
jgi:hypothetical protein